MPLGCRPPLRSAARSCALGRPWLGGHVEGGRGGGVRRGGGGLLLGAAAFFVVFLFLVFGFLHRLGAFDLVLEGVVAVLGGVLLGFLRSADLGHALGGLLALGLT